METYNIYTKLWKKKETPTNEDIEAIVGKVPITIDSLGNITIDKPKALSIKEKQDIEKL